MRVDVDLAGRRRVGREAGRTGRRRRARSTAARDLATRSSRSLRAATRGPGTLSSCLCAGYDDQFSAGVMTSQTMSFCGVQARPGCRSCAPDGSTDRHRGSRRGCRPAGAPARRAASVAGASATATRPVPVSVTLVPDTQVRDVGRTVEDRRATGEIELRRGILRPSRDSTWTSPDSGTIMRSTSPAASASDARRRSARRRGGRCAATPRGDSSTTLSQPSRARAPRGKNHWSCCVLIDRAC